MPATYERAPNKALTGEELKEIVLKDVKRILDRDGLFTNNIAFERTAYEVRVSIHMDNPMYPVHVNTTHSVPIDKVSISKEPQLAAIGTAPLGKPSEEAVVFSEEISRQIQSPNASRVEHDMEVPIPAKDIDTGRVTEKMVKFTGDKPDPASVGNTFVERSTVTDQKREWDKRKRAK